MPSAKIKRARPAGDKQITARSGWLQKQTPAPSQGKAIRLAGASCKSTPRRPPRRRKKQKPVRSFPEPAFSV